MDGNNKHPESNAPNEPMWNAVVVFWGIALIIAVAFALSYFARVY